MSSDGSVLVVEIERGTLSRVGPDGAIDVVAETGGGPNGAAIGPDGKCYVCNNGGFKWHYGSTGLRPILEADNYSGGRIERVDLASGAVEVLYRGVGEIGLNGAGKSASEVARRLADEHNMLCLPGSYFGPGQEAYLRFAFANVEADRMTEIAARLADSQAEF